MLYTTFAKAHEEGACIESYRKMTKSLGGITKYGKDTPIPLDKVIEVCGLQDAIWSLRCTIEESENISIEFACRCAEHVLHFFEDKYPNDRRPRQAIEAARNCITNKSLAAVSAASAASAARSAAYAAVSAVSATWSAARSAVSAARSAVSAARSAEYAAYAAYAAVSAVSAVSAESAEIQWQTEEFLKLLNQ